MRKNEDALSAAVRLLDRLRHWEKIEGLSARFSLPLIDEYELAEFRTLYHAPLRAALDALDRGLRSSPSVNHLAWRGRLRRILGDRLGAENDFRAALTLDESHLRASVWFGEMGLGTVGGDEQLSKTIERFPRDAQAFLYRGAGRLLLERAGKAGEDLSKAARLAPGSPLVLLLLGLARERDGDSKRAESCYAAAARRDAGCSAARLLLSRRASSTGKAAAAFDAALSAEPAYALVSAAKFRPEASWLRQMTAWRRSAFDEPEAVRAYLDQEGEYAPYHTDDNRDVQRLHARRPAAWSAALVGRSALRSPAGASGALKGRRRLSSAIALAPRQGWIYSWRGLAWLKEGRRDRALADFNACVRLKPFYFRCYSWRGALLRRMGRAREALADLNIAVAAEPAYAFAWNERSLARRAVGDFAGAAEDLRRAFLIDHRYGWIYTVGREPTSDEFKRGTAELERAVVLAPGFPLLRVWLGQLHLSRRDISSALLEFSRAVQADPHCAVAHGWYGKALIEAGQPAKASETLDRAVKLGPRTAVFQAWAAEAEILGGEGRRALKRLRGLVGTHPTDWWLHYRFAEALHGQGHLRSALTMIRKSIALEGRHADAHFAAARIQFDRRRYAAAGEEVEKALIISPNLGRAYVLRAEIRRHSGLMEEALADYKTAYRRFPHLFNKDEARRIKELLHP